MYPNDFYRLVVSGSLHATEEFSFGLSVIPDTNLSGGPLPYEEVPQGIIDAVTAFMSSGIISSAAKANLIKFNRIAPNGKYADQGNTVFHEIPGGVGGSQGPTHAPQVAIAVSLGTAKSRGRAARGRFYVPSPNVQLQADTGAVSTGFAESVRLAAVTLINAVNESVAGHYVGVASEVGTGAFEPVTSVRVGRALDTIRSRRTSIPEAYTADTVIIPA